MCQKNKGLHNKIDKCMKPLINWFNEQDYFTIASCCGHSVYPMTIVVKFMVNGKPRYLEILSGIEIKRTRNFYKRDKEGYYFIPECVKKPWQHF